MIETRGLAKSFGSVQALAGLDRCVPAGTTMCLLGPNGAGKTTAVRVLATLLRPDAGWARVAGHDVVADGAAVRERIGMAGQYAAVDECLTGRANLVMIGRLSRIPRREARRRAADLLAALDLEQTAEIAGYAAGPVRRLAGQRALDVPVVPRPGLVTDVVRALDATGIDVDDIVVRHRSSTR